jgi:hypothetical protein
MRYSRGTSVDRVGLAEFGRTLGRHTLVLTPPRHIVSGIVAQWRERLPILRLKQRGVPPCSGFVGSSRRPVAGCTDLF